MGDLFDNYRLAKKAGHVGPIAHDEMFTEASKVRPRYAKIHQALSRMTQEDLRGRTEALADSYLAQGVTFDFAGEERPFPSFRCRSKSY
jgi:uncharacterized circularly permuted ATP-grasp superfamily protein